MVGHRRAIEKKYVGIMSVSGFEKVKVDGETLSAKKEIHKDVSCYLQRNQNKSASNDGEKSNVDYDLKILCAPEIAIPPGCRIKVAQSGMTYDFKYSGEPFIYPTHQEITIKRSDFV